MTIPASLKEGLERFGFRFACGGVHTARTMMLSELEMLLEYLPDPNSPMDEFVQAIEEYNCLGKRSGRTRILTRRHLVELYSLDPGITLFHALRYLWQRDPEGRPLIAFLCAFARDPLLRDSAPFVLNMPVGQLYSREALEEFIEDKYPGRFSPATLKSVAQNLASSWTQAGHFIGRRKKIRSKPKVTSGASAYALLLGFLTGSRGELLFETNYTKILDAPTESSIELAEVASSRGWIVFKRVGNVIEVLFPAILTEQEKEWIREQN